MSGSVVRTMVQRGKSRSAFGAELGSRAFLVVVSPEQFGLLHVVGAVPATIGRAELCRIRLDDPAVSTVHCKVTVAPGRGHIIEDCGSTNGTFVNGRKLEGAVELSYGDRISLGSTILRFYVEEIPDRLAS